jgi:uncharacterized protein (DUF305 family)
MKIKSHITAALVSAALTVSVALAQHPAGHGEAGKQGQNAKTAAAPYDLHFIDMMIEHHQMGIDLAKMAQGKAAHAELKAFAAKTIEEQQKDSDQLKKWRDEWYAGKPKSDHMSMPGMSGASEPRAGTSKPKSGHANMPGMSGMNMQQMDMGKLEAASGNEFDLLFLDMFIPHHQMAIDMSQNAVKRAEHAQLKTFARETVAKQQKEKAQMTKWRAAWGGGSTPTAQPHHQGHTKNP